MRIAVYSGSFNPLHTGHLSVMRTLSESGAFDGVYLVVSPQNPLKDSSNVLSGRERLEAAVLALDRHPELKVRVEDIELTMEAPHYTIRTLDALKKREPGNEFTLVMGADNLDSIRHWRNAPRILNEYGVIVYPRKGYDLPFIRQTLLEESRHFPVPETLDSSLSHTMPGTVSLEELDRMYNISIIDAPIIDISSTEIREKQAAGLDMSEYLM